MESVRLIRTFDQVVINDSADLVEHKDGTWHQVIDGFAEGRKAHLRESGADVSIPEVGTRKRREGFEKWDEGTGDEEVVEVECRDEILDEAVVVHRDEGLGIKYTENVYVENNRDIESRDERMPGRGATGEIVVIGNESVHLMEHCKHGEG